MLLQENIAIGRIALAQGYYSSDALCFFRRILRSQGLRVRKDVPYLGDFCQVLVPDALYSWPLLPHRWLAFPWHFSDKFSSPFALKMTHGIFVISGSPNLILHSLSTLLAPEEGVDVKHMKLWTMFIRNVSAILSQCKDKEENRTRW